MDNTSMSAVDNTSMSAADNTSMSAADNTAMSAVDNTSDESLGAREGNLPDAVANTKETCEQNKDQLESLKESFKEIMMKNQESLKKKEKEAQEYAQRLSKIKSRTKSAKFLRHSKEASSSKDTVDEAESTAKDIADDAIDDISQAKTSKAKSTLLQRKLVENRKVFEQRSKELTETKRAMKEKAEAIRQQLEETNLATVEYKHQSAMTPLVITSEVMSPVQMEDIQKKEKKIMELESKIVDLETTIMDVQENLKEKDAVIDSKTKAIILMSTDLFKKDKTTLESLKDTKDEMATMQENFILIETSLKNKNACLLEQLQERDKMLSELERTIDRFKEQLNEQKIAESTSVDFSSTMDTLAETKGEMKSMQENFVLIESSLKLKNDCLLEQLGEHEVKLAKAKERISQLEADAGTVTTSTIENLQFRIQKLEQNNRQLLDEKYELQKDTADLQDKVIGCKSTCDNVIIEKDNRIKKLENLVEELEQSNELIKEPMTELQQQVVEISSKNEEYSNKIIDLEKQIHELKVEKSDVETKLSHEQTVPKEDETVAKLTKDLEDLNKSMIKLRAQHKNQVKNLQKQLENFKKISDKNAELVKLGNQVALLEEEKGNLQLSLVDFDELKVSAGDWQERVADLETKVSSQTKEMQAYVDAIATLENQKLDIMQELHAVKQEVLSLEGENAESENLRVTAEMKIVELEEQLEATHKEQNESKLEFFSESEYHELVKKIDILTQENTELYGKLSKFEEKGTSDTGSTESFETIQVNDRNDLLKKIEDLEQKNNELTLKLTRLDEKDGSHADSTESFETINDTDRGELLKKIEQLTQENNDLTMKLNRVEEKGSSDTGSTESFERIPEHNDNMMKIELLTQENSELVIKLTKLEEHLSQIESTARLDIFKNDSSSETLRDDDNLRLRIETLTQENDNLMTEIFKFRTQVEGYIVDNGRLEKCIERLTAENNELIINHTEVEERLQTELSHTSQMSVQIINSTDQINVLTEMQQVLEKELIQMREASAKELINVTSCETDNAKSKITILETENEQMTIMIAQLEESIKNKEEELNKSIKEREELSLKLEHMVCDDLSRERSELINKLEESNEEKESVAHERQELHEQVLLQESSISETQKEEDTVRQQSQTMIVACLEKELENSEVLIAEYKNQIQEMNMKLQSLEAQLQEKTDQLLKYEVSDGKMENLERELKDMFATAEEWKFKYDDMQVKMQALEQGKMSIEEAFKVLESDKKELLEVISKKDAETSTLQEHLQNTINMFEVKLQDEVANISIKEREIAELKAEIEKKDQELHNKYLQLQNDMITIESLQDKLNNCSIKLEENQMALLSELAKITKLNDIIMRKEEEVHILKKNINDITEVLEQSKPLVEFNEAVENLRIKEASYIELQSKYDDIVQENNELCQNILKCNETFNDNLMKKEQEINDSLAAKKDLDTQIEKIKNEKTIVEKQIWELQTILHKQSKYAEEMQSELKNEYKQMEQLKIKHVEDVAMLNRRLEDVIEDLNVKIQENEIMKIELKQKEEEEILKNVLLKNITEDVKITLEGKIVNLEEKLSESENKLQMQSEKMKKIMAAFNKKKIACQELETRVAELEEKWTTEKDEKEVKNKQIQEVENSMREKDNKIIDLEEKLLQANNDTAEALANSDKFANESTSLKEKIAILIEQNTEMGEEIERQRIEIEHISLEITKEETAKKDIIMKYELYKENVSKENEQNQTILDEVKEKARELSVRMQVMETEYVEQLATIKNLQAENGLLSSKQTQINEKLENVEKESEERRILIEQLQKELTNMAASAITVQPAEQNMREDETTKIAQHCEHSEQCQNLVQALEARLQERQAEIENLNNELANSYGNIVLLHDESLRYNNMMMQTAQERFNQSLMYRTNELQQEIDSLKAEKNVNEQKISQLEIELEEYKRVESKGETLETTEISVIESEPEQMTQDNNSTLPSFESKSFDTNISEVSLSPESSSEVNTLMDNKKIEQLQSLLTEKENLCTEYLKRINILVSDIGKERRYTQELNDEFLESQDKLANMDDILSEKEAEVDLLKMELEKVTLQMNEQEALREKYYFAKTEMKKFEQLMIKKNTQINSLIEELNVVTGRTDAQLQQHAHLEADLQLKLSLRDNEICAMKIDLISAKEIANALTAERNNQNYILKSYKSQIENLEAEARNVQTTNIDTDMKEKWEQVVSAALVERDLLQLQVDDLTRTLQELRESSQHNLQIELENDQREKHQAQLVITNVTQEDSQKNINKAEAELRTQVNDLQNKVKDLEAQNIKFAEDNKTAQVRSGKLVKKLKEYKMQIQTFEQELKTRKENERFNDNNTTIIDDLKMQIMNIEKAFYTTKQTNNAILAEKGALIKQLNVISSANERYMELRQQQQRKINILSLYNIELNNTLTSVRSELEALKAYINSLQYENQPNPSTSYKVYESVDTTSKYKKEINDLKDELKVLAGQKEQLQNIIIQMKVAILNLQAEKSNNIDLAKKFADYSIIFNNQTEQLQSALNKSKDEYEVLRKQFEQSLIDSNNLMVTMEQKSDQLKIEFTEKVNKLESEIDNLQKALAEMEQSKVNALMNSEEKLSSVNASLTEVTELLNARVQEVADLKQELQIQHVERQQIEAMLHSDLQDLAKQLNESKQKLVDASKQAVNREEHELTQQSSMETITVINKVTEELVEKHTTEIAEKNKEILTLTEMIMAIQPIDDDTLSLEDRMKKLNLQEQHIMNLKEDLIEQKSIMGTIQMDMKLKNEILQKKQEAIKYDEEKEEVETHLADIQRLQDQLNYIEMFTEISLQEYSSRIRKLEENIHILKSENEFTFAQHDDEETKKCRVHPESDDKEQNFKADVLRHNLREKIEQLNYINMQLRAKKNDLKEINIKLINKDSLLTITNQELNEKLLELEKLHSESRMIKDSFVSHTSNNDNAELQRIIKELKTQIEAKQQELERLKYVVRENAYPAMIQKMQDQINCLHNEKAILASSHTQALMEKQEQVNLLTQRINEQHQEHEILKKEVDLLPRERRSVHDQEQIVRLQNELHLQEQEINDLKYIIAERDSQLRLQVSMEPQSDNFELRESVQRLSGELYGKEQEVRTLKSTIAELQKEILRLQNFEKFSEDNKNTIEKLILEKEEFRDETEQFLYRESQKKESEISEIKQKLSEENQKLLAEVQLRDYNIEDLTIHLEKLRIIGIECNKKLQQKERELMHTIDALAKTERRFAELSITKDTELHNLKMQIREKDARIEEFVALSVEEEKQLEELRQTLASTETGMNRLKELPERNDSRSIQHALNENRVSVVENAASITWKTAPISIENNTELNLALYMLHQRDVRCEELTHELMQLLSERDLLQLRLSSALRLIEEFKRTNSIKTSLTKDLASTSQATREQPVLEQSLPSNFERSIEFSNEAVHVPIEDQETLDLKLSQLHSVGYTKDVRLKDERELRHSQQISLLTHRNVATTSSETSTTLVNANYTVSRNVESPSSVFLKWLRGKSTPKVVHM